MEKYFRFTIFAKLNAEQVTSIFRTDLVQLERSEATSQKKRLAFFGIPQPDAVAAQGKRLGEGGNFGEASIRIISAVN